MFAQLAKYFTDTTPHGVLAAFLFGSHARGSTHAGSDLDVAVLLDPQATLTRQLRSTEAERLTTALIGAIHQNDVDVIVLNDAPPELAVAVLDTGRIVYVAHTAADALHTFTRTARLRHADLKPFLDRTRRMKLEALAR